LFECFNFQSSYVTTELLLKAEFVNSCHSVTVCVCFLTAVGWTQLPDGHNVSVRQILSSIARYVYIYTDKSSEREHYMKL